MKYRVLILGGGAGGISLAARLRKRLPAGSVAVVEPNEFHYYQPLWTLVGAGIVPKEKSRRPQRTVIPRGVAWICDRVQSIHPAEREVRTGHGQVLSYDALVVATGLELDYAQIPGLESALGHDGVCSIYDYDGAAHTAQLLKNFEGGRAVFTMPPVPIKCAGAPQKILYLADQIFRRRGVRAQTQLEFYTAGKVIFGVPEFAQALLRVVARKDIRVHYGHRLVAVHADSKSAVFETENGPVEVDYDLLHAVPPMRASNLIRDSGLAFETGPHAGWLAVHENTLQHVKFPEIFGIGDVTGIPNSKTAAAIRKQVPVVLRNLCHFLAGHASTANYDGYSSCPLVTEKGKVILAEFGYGGKLLPTFPGDATRERRTMWWLKRYLLPLLYWKGMIRGRA